MQEINPESYDACFNAAMRILQRAMQTESKLTEKLIRRGFAQPTVATVIARLKELDLINDQKYAQNYISYRSRTTPLGSRYLRLKLLQKGLAKEIINSALAEISPEDELEHARQVAAKKLTHLSKDEPAKQKEKLARFLLARGFNSGIVYRVIKEF